MKKRFLINNIYISLVLILFIIAALFYPDKAYLSCDKSQNICKFKQVSAIKKEYIKTAQLTSLAEAQAYSYSGKRTHKRLMYIIDNSKSKDDNVFVQFNFETLQDAKNQTVKFNNYLSSDDNEFSFEYKEQAKTYRNILMFWAFCFAICLANLYFDMSKN